MSVSPKLNAKVRCLDGSEGRIVDIRGHDVMSTEYLIRFKGKQWGRKAWTLWMPPADFMVI